MMRSEKIEKISILINDLCRKAKKGPLNEDELLENKYITEALVEIASILLEPNTTF